jgi:hypothetical protein
MAETAAQKKARLAKAAKAALAKKEKTYIDSFSNPITSPNDPRIGINAGANPAMAGMMTSSGVPPKGATGPTGPSGPGATGATGATGAVVTAKLISTYVDPETGDIIDVYDDGTEKIRKAGNLLATAAAEKVAKGQSAYDLLFERFNEYGLGALVTPLKDFIQEGLSSSEFTLRLRDTDAYKKRFAANAQRVAKGLSALSESQYVGLEDQYQNIMRQYGLPASYYARGEMGRQEGFEKFLANDISATELEDRIMTAQSRVTNANPEVRAALKQFYPGIGDGDILAYTLDPEKAITDIKRKVTAAEIGGAAIQAGLGANVARAEQLGQYGVDKGAAEKGFGTIAGGLERGSQLASMYGESPYTQTTAEEEIFNLQGAQESRKKRQKVTSLEQATFGGKTGVTSGALARDRAGAY